jgi:hypothetical protein
MDGPLKVPGFPPEKICGGTKKKQKTKNNKFFEVEITPLMSFRHLKRLNSASKCLTITLKKLLTFQSQKQISPKNQLMSISCLG